MGNINTLSDDPAKFLLLGEQGHGKTGTLASIICAGYKVRLIDTDKGAKLLRSLLTDERYPYAKYIKSHNIDLVDGFNYIPVDTPMALRMISSKKEVAGKIHSIDETLLAPKHGKAWTKAIDSLMHWKDAESGVDYGNYETWGGDTVLVIDTFSTLAMNCFYFIQELNGRLGAREEGYDYQRDVGGAQRFLRRLLEALFNSAIKCNVIVMSHITKIDDSQGFNQSPEQRAREGSRNIEAKGLPAAIGQALSPFIGKYFNDSFTVRRTGNGTNTQRNICTTPIAIANATVDAKNSVWLEREYNITTGLAEIMAALRYQPPPTELIQELRGSSSIAGARPSANPGSSTAGPRPRPAA